MAISKIETNSLGSTSVIHSDTTLALQTNGTTTAVTIDASQNVGIGTTPAFDSGSGLEVQRADVATVRLEDTLHSTAMELKAANGAVAVSGRGNYPLLFETNGSERMRIAANGNVGIGVSPDFKLQVAGTMLQTSGWAVLGAHNGNGTYPAPTDVGVAFAWNFTSGGREVTMMNNDTSGAGFRFVQRTGTSSNTYLGQTNGSGQWIQGNNSSTWTTVSDARIKQNIRPISSALDKVNELKPCHFEYIDKAGKVKTGFIAQEFETVFPGHIIEQEFIPEEYKEAIPEGDKLKGIDADLVPYLVKAIQELNAKVDAQAAEIASLKGAK